MWREFDANQKAPTVICILTAGVLALTTDLNPGRDLFSPPSYTPVQHTLPSLQVNAACNDCGWSSSLSRRVAEGYLKSVMASGLIIDDREVIEVVIHKIDHATGLVHASASFSDISLALTPTQSMSNRGMSLRQMGAELAEKLAVELYR